MDAGFYLLVWLIIGLIIVTMVIKTPDHFHVEIEGNVPLGLLIAALMWPYLLVITGSYLFSIWKDENTRFGG